MPLRRLGRGLSLVVLILLALALPGLFRLATSPSHLRLLPGEPYPLETGLLYRWVDTEGLGWLSSGDRGPRLQGESLGQGRLELRFLGWVPLGAMQVSVVPRVQMVPGGQSIGVMAAPRGLVIARTIPVRTAAGDEQSPAAEAGVRDGDRLVAVDDQPVRRSADVERITRQAGQAGRAVRLQLERGDDRLTLQVRPVRVQEGEQELYLLGIVLQESTAGVGTLTFFDPARTIFAALGHQVTDARERPVVLDQGQIVAAQVEGLHPSLSGQPGEKVAVLDGTGPLGVIEKNTPFGIYGRLLREPPPGAFTRPVPVALAQEVRPGPAQMLTVLDGQRVEAFEVAILEVRGQRTPSDRGLVLEITDPSLLSRTEGIVQGMSGSPILQNGRLVGALTHVFVNDPRRGFGILAEWMVYETGLDQLRTEPEVLPETPAERRKAS